MEIIARQGEAAALNIRPISSSSYHIKVPLTIGSTASLIKRVALKRALTQSADMVLHLRKRGDENDREGGKKDDAGEEITKVTDRRGMVDQCRSEGGEVQEL